MHVRAVASDNPERKLDSMFWKPPLVQIREALVSPFFTTKPLPRFLSASYMDYFIAGLMELSQLSHEVATNTPIRGYRVSHVLRNFLIFHIQNFLDISFRDDTFMDHLYAKNSYDEGAVNYISFLRIAQKDFVAKWDVALEPQDDYADPLLLKEYWVAVKKSADVISAQTIALRDIRSRIVLRLPWLRLLDIYTTQGHLSEVLVIGCLCWGIAVAFFVDIMIWLMWHKPALWNAILSTLVCTTAFGGFLLFFYTFSRRRALAEWFAEEMSSNLSRENFMCAPIRPGQPSARDRDLEFFIRPKEDGVVRGLTIKPVVINRQVVMIGVTDVATLKICSWNLCARIATEITWEQAIGKSLEAVMDPRSVPAVRSLFAEIKQNSRQQKRLLFNSITKGTVAINATATIAHVDGVPVGMIVGTVLDEEERAMMSYFSRTGICALACKLRQHNIVDPITTGLALANSWDELKDRTTQAIRSWRSSNVDELTQPLNEAVRDNVVRLQIDKGIPAQFQCDVSFIQNLFEKLLRLATHGSTNGAVPDVILGNVKDEMQHCQMLRIIVVVPEGCSMDIKSSQELLNVISTIGYLFDLSDHRAEVLVPISPATIAPAKEVAGAMDASPKLLVCTFVIFEPDPVYRSHLCTYCGRQQHRFFVVDSVESLASMLDNLGNDVSAVITSAVDERFEAVAHLCRSRNVFLVATKIMTDISPQLFDASYDGPPQDTHDIGYVLHKPIKESSWLLFLDHLRVVKMHQRTLQAPACHECRKLRRIGSGANSRIDLVRDVVTGGLMARKTVYIGIERPLSALTTEVDIMCRLSGHPCIVRYVSSYAPNPRQYCMFFQYCKDGSLQQYVQRQPQKRLTVVQLAPFAFQLLSAVEFIHSKGVAHRDIKPANILMYDETHLKLADFGSASMQSSMAGKIAGGTLQFMAPERLADIDTFQWEELEMSRLFAEDIWSLGLTLLDLIGAYPEELRHLSDVGGYMQAYVTFRDKQEELSFVVPFDDSPTDLVAEATDFIRCMLLLHPSARASAVGLMRHPFIADVEWDRELKENPMLHSSNTMQASTHSQVQQVDPMNSSSFFTADESPTDDDDYADSNDEAYHSVIG